MDISIITKSGYGLILSEQWKFLKMSASFLSISVVPMVVPFITVLFAGSISEAHLDGVGLASTLFSVFVISMSAGYATVFDTYGPQVYGSPQRDQLGTVLVKCLLQGGLVSLIMLGPFLNMVYVIDFLPESVMEGNANGFRDIAVQYIRLVAVIDFLEYAFILISKYFAIQGHSNYANAVSFTMIGSFFLANYILVTLLELGVLGLGLAAIIGRVVPLIVAVVLCVIKVRTKEFIWTDLSLQVLTGWKPMLLLGISGAVNVLAELALFEFSSFFSQFDGTTTFTVVIIAMQILNVAWSFTEAIARAGATLIGAALGNGSVETVKIHMVLTMVNTLVECITLAVSCFLMRSYLVGIFNPGQEAIELFNETFWLVCVSMVTYHINNGLLQGVLVAFGEQNFIAWSKSIACYGVGLPIVIVTIFYMDLKVVGVITGWIVSDLIIIAAALWKISKINIEKEIEKTELRVKTELLENTEYSLISTKESSTFGEDEEMRVKNEKCMVAESDDHKDDEAEIFLQRKMEFKFVSSNREIRYVIAAFFISAVVCVVLVGISFRRGSYTPSLLTVFGDDNVNESEIE